MVQKYKWRQNSINQWHTLIWFIGIELVCVFYSSLQLSVSSLYPPAASRPFGKDQSIAIMMYSPVYVRIILSLQLGPQFAIWNYPSDVHYFMYVFFVSDVTKYIS